jgi:ERCC4-type nuclease
VILYDPRFGSAKGHDSIHRAAVDALRKLAPVEEGTLTCGDFMFIGSGPDGPISIGAELKSVSDFITSMRSGRLKEQVACMLDTYARTYLVIEGVYRARRGSGVLELPRGKRWLPINAGPRPVFWTDMERFIVGLEEAGVRMRYTRSTEQTARMLWNVLYGFWDKDYKDHDSLNGMYRPNTPLELVREDPDRKTARMVACCLPGIGWGRSAAVVDTFGSIEGMADASTDAWAGVPGIGKKIATDCYRAIRVKVSRSPSPSARRVSARAGVSPRSVRHSRRRQDAELDAGRRTQRGVSEVVTRSRFARRS